MRDVKHTCSLFMPYVHFSIILIAYLDQLIVFVCVGLSGQVSGHASGQSADDFITSVGMLNMNDATNPSTVVHSGIVSYCDWMRVRMGCSEVSNTPPPRTWGQFVLLTCTKTSRSSDICIILYHFVMVILSDIG